MDRDLFVKVCDSNDQEKKKKITDRIWELETGVESQGQMSVALYKFRAA